MAVALGVPIVPSPSVMDVEPLVPGGCSVPSAGEDDEFEAVAARVLSGSAFPSSPEPQALRSGSRSRQDSRRRCMGTSF
jgi:hypothetical protein